MDIKSWFETSGSYADGLALYRQLPGCNNSLLRQFSKECKANFLTLKYELKKALEEGKGVTVPTSSKSAPQALKKPTPAVVVHDYVEKSADAAFEKETMAMYPPELHGTYRNRITDFYRACEIKMKLNALNNDDEESALEIIIELEELWDRIDRYWMILNHWKENKRIMPVEQSQDFAKMNGIQLVNRRGQLETSISKRKITLNRLKEQVEGSPEDRTKLNAYNKKKEQLQQLIIDLETIRILLKNEGSQTT